jgi:hypothetical protein
MVYPSVSAQIEVGCGKLFRHCSRNVVEGTRSVAPSFLTSGWLLIANALGREKESTDSRRRKIAVMLRESDNLSGQRAKRNI